MGGADGGGDGPTMAVTSMNRDEVTDDLFGLARIFQSISEMFDIMAERDDISWTVFVRDISVLLQVAQTDNILMGIMQGLVFRLPLLIHYTPNIYGEFLIRLCMLQLSWIILGYFVDGFACVLRSIPWSIVSTTKYALWLPIFEMIDVPTFQEDTTKNLVIEELRVQRAAFLSTSQEKNRLKLPNVQVEVSNEQEMSPLAVLR